MCDEKEEDTEPKMKVEEQVVKDEFGVPKGNPDSYFNEQNPLFTHPDTKGSPRPSRKHAPPTPIPFPSFAGGLESEDESDEEVSDAEFQRKMGIAFGFSQTQHYAKEVGTCEGTDKKNLLTWLRAVSETPCPKDVAIATARGPLGEYLKRRKGPWELLYRKIAHEFISPSFSVTQRDVLETLKQRPNESLLKFNTEFLLTLHEAYPEPPEDQIPLVRTYLSALHDRSLAREVLKQNPDSFSEAIKQTTELNRLEDGLKPPKTSGRTAAIEMTPEAVALQKNVEAVLQMQTDTVSAQKQLSDKVISLTQQIASIKGQPKGQPTNKGQGQKPPIAKNQCLYCGKIGHWAKDCRLKQKQQQPYTNTQHAPYPTYAQHTVPQYTQQPAVPNAPTPKPIYSAPPPPHTATSTAFRCLRCRSTNHTIENCRSGPPRRPCYCGGSHWLFDCPERKTTKPRNDLN